jgi:hypothetical protein
MLLFLAGLCVLANKKMQFMTLRRLNIKIQGLPESYASEPYLSDMVIGEPHPLSSSSMVGLGPPPEPMSLYPPPHSHHRSSPLPIATAGPGGPVAAGQYMDHGPSYPSDHDGTLGVVVVGGGSGGPLPSTIITTTTTTDRMAGTGSTDTRGSSRVGPDPAIEPPALPEALAASPLTSDRDGGGRGDNRPPSVSASSIPEPTEQDAANPDPAVVPSTAIEDHSSGGGSESGGNTADVAASVPPRQAAASTPPLTSGEGDDDEARSIPGVTPVEEKKVEEDPSLVVPLEATTPV